MDAEKILSSISESEVWSLMIENILDNHTNLSKEKKKEIVKKLQRKEDDKLFRGINNLSNKNIHMPETEINPPTPFNFLGIYC